MSSGHFDDFHPEPVRPGHVPEDPVEVTMSQRAEELRVVSTAAELRKLAARKGIRSAGLSKRDLCRELVWAGVRPHHLRDLDA